MCITDKAYLTFTPDVLEKTLKEKKFDELVINFFSKYICFSLLFHPYCCLHNALIIFLAMLDK